MRSSACIGQCQPPSNTAHGRRQPQQLRASRTLDLEVSHALPALLSALRDPRLQPTPSRLFRLDTALEGLDLPVGHRAADHGLHRGLVHRRQAAEQRSGAIREERGNATAPEPAPGNGRQADDPLRHPDGAPLTRPGTTGSSSSSPERPDALCAVTPWNTGRLGTSLCLTFRGSHPVWQTKARSSKPCSRPHRLHAPGTAVDAAALSSSRIKPRPVRRCTAWPV